MEQEYRRLSRLPAIALAFCVASSPVLSVDLNMKAMLGVNLGLNAQVGIDQATRDYLNTLPVELRQQVVEAVRESLTLLDASVKQYIDELDTMLAKQVLNAQCAAVGVVGNGIGQLKQSVIGTKPMPIEDLRKDKDATIRAFKPGNAPGRYSDVYVDLLTRIKTTSCNVQIEPAAKAPVDEMYQDAFKRWMIWNRLSASKCSDAFACFSQIKANLTTKIVQSDARDLDAVDARERLSAVVAPVDPGHWDRWFGKWDPTQAELSLRELLSIDDGVSTAMAVRELKATVLITDVKSVIGTTAAAASSTLLRLGQVGTDAELASYASIWQAVDPVINMKDGVRWEISQAISLSPDQRTEYAAVKSEYEAALQNALQQANAAHARYDDKNKILQQKAQAAQQRIDSHRDGPLHEPKN